MPDPERLYFIRDRLVARGPDRGFGPYSIILCCPTCGAAGWGRIVLGGSALPPWFRAFDSICPTCPPGPSPWQAAGSFFPACRAYQAALGTEFAWADNLPCEIIEREALLHLKYPYLKHVWIDK